MSTYAPTNPVSGESRGTPELWIAYLRSAGARRMADVESYCRTMYRVAPNVGLGAHKLICQAHHETAGFTSAAWEGSCNPAGIGVTSDAMRNWYDFGDGTNAALAHLVHVGLYVFGTLPPVLEAHRSKDPRANAVPASILGRKQFLKDFGGSTRDNSTWAADPLYGQKWADTLNRLAPVFATPQAGDPAMGYKQVRFVGLAEPVYLPDDILVEIAIVPASITNVRSNQPFSGQTSYTQHETANFNTGANADMHKRWLHSGAGGAYVGFNFAVDDRKIIQLTPLNEVTWAAGTPEGNKYSYHCELCVNADIDHMKARRNAAALAGGIFAAKGWDSTKLVQHNKWTGKDCPMLLRRENRWPAFVANVSTFIASARNADTPVSTARAFRLKTDLPIRSAPGFKPPVMTWLERGTTGTVIAGPTKVDGIDWYDVMVPGFGTGFVPATILSTLEIAA